MQVWVCTLFSLEREGVQRLRASVRLGVFTCRDGALRFENLHLTGGLGLNSQEPGRWVQH